MIDRLRIHYQSVPQEIYLCCSHCQEQLVQLSEVTQYLETHQSLQQGFEGQFLLIPQPANIKLSRIIFELIDLATQVEEPFILMQTTPCFCFQCEQRIGLYIYSASERDKRWLSKTILLDAALIKWSPRIAQQAVLKTFADQLRSNQQKKEEASSQNQIITRSIVFDFDGVIKEALENIVFYCQALNHLEQAIQDVGAKWKFKKAKMMYEIKSNKK